jgi:hypothetical protein
MLQNKLTSKTSYRTRDSYMTFEYHDLDHERYKVGLSLEPRAY